MKSRITYTIDVEHNLEYNRHNSSRTENELANVLYDHTQSIKHSLQMAFRQAIPDKSITVGATRYDVIVDLEEDEAYKDLDKAVLNHAIDRLTDLIGLDIYGSELHHELFNVEYFVIGYHYAQKYLDAYGVFDAIGEIVEYENDNFGMVNTELDSSEKVLNMLTYIKGEELLSDHNIHKVLDKHWDSCLPQKSLKKVLKLLKEIKKDGYR